MSLKRKHLTVSSSKYWILQQLVYHLATNPLFFLTPLFFRSRFSPQAKRNSWPVRSNRPFSHRFNVVRVTKGFFGPKVEDDWVTSSVAQPGTSLQRFNGNHGWRTVTTLWSDDMRKAIRVYIRGLIAGLIKGKTNGIFISHEKMRPAISAGCGENREVV